MNWKKASAKKTRAAKGIGHIHSTVITTRACKTELWQRCRTGLWTLDSGLWTLDSGRGSGLEDGTRDAGSGTELGTRDAG
ncbi:hypothetical protein EOD39_13561 [Acipenser ruthenus]|uniref:Uncharacterized protein n=1 Tax=Acipenser ruthenus TaxID=7906 RepID=A0A662YQM4_ACIRT|nr:hypothetical protein EOD39_13561 [Acipenser ruthenus]